MNTFLPSPNFSLCASILDNKRLNKQITECYQLILGQWPNHPASKMWKNNKIALMDYTNKMLHEWKNIRGKNHKFDFYNFQENELILPDWLGNPLVHISHRVNLLRKNFDWYSKFDMPETSHNLQNYPEGYYWPIGPWGKVSLEHTTNWLNFSKK